VAFYRGMSSATQKPAESFRPNVSIGAVRIRFGRGLDSLQVVEGVGVKYICGGCDRRQDALSSCDFETFETMEQAASAT
jgi:hypothetical protein